MLVMRRKAGESLLIGDDIEIEILEISPTRVKIGIVAPERVAVTRKEVHLTAQQNLSASRPVSPESISWLARELTAVKTLTPAHPPESAEKS